MGTKTRSQTKKQTPVEIIVDDDEDEDGGATTPPQPPEESKKQQDRTQKSEQQTSSTTTSNRTPTGKSKYFQQVITTPSPASLKTLIPDDNNLRYDLPEELKILPEEIIPVSSSSIVANSSNGNGKRVYSLFDKNRTSLSDDEDLTSEEEEVPVSKKKKPNKSTEIMEPILISSIASEIQSIPDDEEIISTKVTSKEKSPVVEKKEENIVDTAVNLEVITASPAKKDPIDIKIEKWNDEWKQIAETYRTSRHNLFEEVFDELKKDWSLKEENKSRFKQGLELAGKLMNTDSQKSRLFYLTLSYYIVFEKKDIKLIGNLYDSLSGSMETNPLLVSVDFSSIEFEIVCKEYNDKKDILTLLKKYHSLSLIEKLKQTTTNSQSIARFGQLSNIINHQHNEIRKYQAKEKK